MEMVSLAFGILLLTIIIGPLFFLNYFEKRSDEEFLRRRTMRTVSNIKQIPWVCKNNKFSYKANPNTDPEKFLLLKSLELDGYVVHDYMLSDPFTFILTPQGENFLEQDPQ